MSQAIPKAASPPLRVVVFTGGPVLEDACVELAGRIDATPALDLVGVFCETREPGLGGIARDLFRRRGWLAPALLLQRATRRLARMLLSPCRERARRQVLHALGPRIHFVPDLHARDVLAQIEALRAGIGAVYGGPILQPQLFALPTKGTIGIHHGLLPRYRGKKTTFWAVNNGEPEVGVAIQRIGAGLDRGDILRDATLPVGRRPLPSLVRELERVGLQIYLEALRELQRGEGHAHPQPQDRWHLFRDPTPGEMIRFWLRDLERILGRRRPDSPEQAGP